MKKADMIKLLSLQEQLIAKQEEQIKALREERPMWAQGFTSDSVAAQVRTASLHQIWKELGVSSQTECMQKLRELAAAAPGAVPDVIHGICDLCEAEGELIGQKGSRTMAGLAYCRKCNDKP